MDLNIEQAIAAFRQGRMLILTDHEERENEGDLIMPAGAVTAEDVNFAAQHGRGLICVALAREICRNLRLNQQTAENTALLATRFTISVDAARGASTGISCADRAHTINLLADPQSRPEDFGRPGHVFPIEAAPGGVLERQGQTEGSTDLARLAGLPPAAMLCEIMNADGTMARRSALQDFSEQFQIPIVTIHDLITWRIMHEMHVRCTAQTRMPNAHGEWRIFHYEDANSGEEHLALTLGEPEKTEAPLTRIHSKCFTGDTFGSLRCDCGPQLDESMRLIAAEGCGIVVYMMQEGRGIGLKAKLKAYELQDQGQDTVEANVSLGFRADLRDYGTSAQILRTHGINKLRLLTNNPDKVNGLGRYGFTVERVPLEVGLNKDNARYLKTKQDKLGHIFSSIFE